MTNSRGKVSVTPEELIALLTKTAVPTVVVEGHDDVIVFRRLEDIYSDRFLTILPAGGRDAVLRIFGNRHHFPNDPKIVFIADRDTWVLTDVPERFKADVLFFSDGYALENDAFRDGDFFNIMDGGEKAKFLEEVKKFTQWYAHCVCRYMKGEEVEISAHPEQVLSGEAAGPRLDQIVHDNDMQEISNRIIANPAKLLRGKALIAILMRQLNRKGRAATHHSRSLLDKVGAAPGPLIRRLFEEIGRATV